MTRGQGDAGDLPNSSFGRRVTALVRVILSGLVGVVVAGATASLAPWQVSSLIAWDTGAAVFCAWVWFAVRGAACPGRQRNATIDAGRVRQLVELLDAE